MFLYNWQVRDEWFDVLSGVPEEELTKERVGGLGSILLTMFHIIDVEYSWIRGIEGFKDPEPKYEDYLSLNAVYSMSAACRNILRPILDTLTPHKESLRVQVPWSEDSFTYGEVLRHAAAHEIHHMGQLSIWAKELNIRVPSANFIGRGLANRE